MAGARTTDGGETKWSKCSAEKLKRFNKACVFEQESDATSTRLQQLSEETTAVTADEQCQLFLKDKTAAAAENSCASLLCSSKLVRKQQRLVN